MFDFRRNHILQALLLAAIVALVFVLREVAVALFVAFLFTLMLEPVVRKLHGWHVPRPIAVFVPIIVLIGFFVLLGYFALPNLINEGRQFIQKAPNYLAKLENLQIISQHLNVDSIKQALQGHFSSFSSVFFTATTRLVKLLTGVVTVIVVTLYWVTGYDRIKATLLTYFPKKHRRRAEDVWGRIEIKIVNWAKAQVLLSVVVGLLVWLGAWIIGLPFAGLLGFIAGLLEVIPTVGPIAAAIPGILLGFTISPKVALFALIMYLIVQQIENHLLAPQLLGRTVKLHPIIVIISLLVGALIYGILGALLAVPAALCISSIVDSYRGEPAIPSKKQQPSSP
jgi:predicted PurR-regulated permease PerM